MKLKIWAIILVLTMVLAMVGCGAAEEEEETTLTGMVVSVEGTVISLMEMDTANMGSGFGGGQRPGGFGGFDPGSFDGTMPTGDFPQWGNGEMPEDFTMPEGGQMPNFGGGDRGDFDPESMTMPEDGSMPNFGGSFPGGNGQRPEGQGGFGGFTFDAETKDIDIADAHISVQEDGVKASGSLSDIKAGTMVTITLNGKGEATYVLITSYGFGGRGNFGN